MSHDPRPDNPVGRLRVAKTVTRVRQLANDDETPNPGGE